MAYFCSLFGFDGAQIIVSGQCHESQTLHFCAQQAAVCREETDEHSRKFRANLDQHQAERRVNVGFINSAAGQKHETYSYHIPLDA